MAGPRQEVSVIAAEAGTRVLLDDGRGVLKAGPPVLAWSIEINNESPLQEMLPFWCKEILYGPARTDELGDAGPDGILYPNGSVHVWCSDGQLRWFETLEAAQESYAK